MSNVNSNRFNLGVLATAIMIAAVAILSGVMATRAYEDDGRINLVYHLGGDAVFCAGPNGENGSDSYVGGGIRLLSAGGQELFFVPAASIDSVPEMPLVDTRIAQGWGSHGVVELWRLANGDFSLVGQDEHGKQYIFQWTGCTPIGPAADHSSAGDSADEPECEEPMGNQGNDYQVPLIAEECPQATQEPRY